MSVCIQRAERILLRRRPLDRAWCRLCSHILKTRIPRSRNAFATNRARRRFPLILALQYRLFPFGIRKQRRHPCQKQPSTKIAIFCFGNQKSGRPKTELGCMCQPRIRILTKKNRSRISVERLPVDRTFDIWMLRSYFERLSISDSSEIL